MASDCENLRRSKRNKYHLDVSALSLSNPEKKSKSLSSAEEVLNYAAVSPGTSVDKAEIPEISAEDNKRSRRPTTKNASFVYADESEDEDEKVTTGMFGTYKCEKCPSRFESRPGLANHLRLHGRSDKRKFGCDQCDFSCGSAKAIRNHKRIHNRPFKEISPIPLTNSDTRSDTSDSHTPPLLTPVRNELPVNEVTPPNANEPPKLAAISPTLKVEERSSNRKRHRCSECPFAVRNRRRYERHLLMHNRSSGFQCHACSLTTFSCGFLKRHIVEIHKVNDFPWPPKFFTQYDKKVKEEEEEEEEELTVDTVEKKKQLRAKLLLRSAKTNGEILRCPVENCAYQCYMSCQMVLHKRRVHLPRSRRPSYRCCSCGLKLRSPGALRVHRLIRHPLKKMSPKKKKILIKEQFTRFIYRRAYVEASKEALNSSDSSTPSAPSPSLPTSHSAPSLTSLVDSSDTVSSSLLGMDLPDCLKGITFAIAELTAELDKSQQNEFKCEECPFSTNARTKLDRHTVKHQIKSDVQCPLCSFSCRGDDLIKQHVRLHMAIIHKRRQEAEKLVGYLPPILLTPSKGSSSKSADTTPGKPEKNGTPKKKRNYILVITKEGLRMKRCLECPYATKHACDLASHMTMHAGEPSRYKCTQCTYSTKRAVSLKTHYLVHKEENADQASVKSQVMKLNGVTCGRRSGIGKNRIYTCNKCPMVTKSVVSLHHHYRNHLNSKGAAYKCSKCPFYSLFSEVVEEHILLHEDMNVKTERLNPPTRAKRTLDETQGRSTPVSRPKRTPKSSAAPSPAPPVLVKEEPMDYEETKSGEITNDASEEQNDLSIPLDKPLSIVVQNFIRPEPALLKVIRRERNAETIGQCPDCPFQESDELMMRMHRACHVDPPRPMACDLCNFSCMAPETLHNHITLHLPALSPNSERLERKKAAQRRRAQAAEVIPQGVPHFSCTKCTFKCLIKDTYQSHMLQHAQELQRRLLTTMKRTNPPAEETKTTKPGRRVSKKSDKYHCCSICSFRCETNSAFIRHQEMHGSKDPHQCKVCNYRATTRQIIVYHEMNHHIDHTLAAMTKNAILAPDAVSMKVERTEEKIHKMADNVFRCQRCPEFICYELLQLRRHFEAHHHETPADKEAVESLALGMLPRNSIITTA